MNLTPSVKFINILCAAFALADPESTKNTVKLSFFFALLGSVDGLKSCSLKGYEIDPRLESKIRLKKDF